MKPVYVGGVRGYRSAIYRPGEGWSGDGIRRFTGLRLAAPGRNLASFPCPLTVSRQRRPGVKTKVAILAGMIAIAAMLALVFAGSAQL
ncbi:MAG: hypothetical protein GXY46_07110 [Actinobacteria bacterium]|nr:hypothetical protein [Actinomycetota bacterium]